MRAPQVLASVVVGVAIYYGLGAAGLLVHPVAKAAANFPMGAPLPTLGFLKGMPVAVHDYLPLALPFAILTVIGGINVTESARIAGDDYNTRDILLTEAVATLIAGVCGGVSQSTPYIGHPAYKAMGGRAGYTLATGLFIGLGGIFGYIAFMADALPKPALAPILVFVALDITEQAYIATPKRHAAAVTLAVFPSVAQLVQIFLSQTYNGALMSAAIDPAGTMKATGLTNPDFISTVGVMVMLAHGFILDGDALGRRARVPHRPAHHRRGDDVRRVLGALVFRIHPLDHAVGRDLSAVADRIDPALPLGGRLSRVRDPHRDPRQHARGSRRARCRALNKKRNCFTAETQRTQRTAAEVMFAAQRA